MALQQYGLTAWRIGKYKGETLKLASTREMLGKAGRPVKFPQNSSDTYTARRFLPYGSTAASPNIFFAASSTTSGVDRGEAIVNAHKTAEGVSSTPEFLTPQDTQVVMQQFDCTYGFTDKMMRLGEDDLLAAMSKQIAQRTTFVNELQVYGTLKGGTNVFYGGTGTSRATTNGGLSLNMIRKIIRSLDANHAEEVTEVLAAGTKYSTTPVEGGYLFYGHTDLAPDVRELTGFTKAVEYATGTPMMGELGAVEKVRFMLSPEFAPIIDGGASVASTPGFQSTNGTNNDVYTFVITAADAWSSVAVRGMDAMKISLVMPESSASDLHGQRGYTGACWWKATLIENQFWMIVGHVLAKSLPN